MIYSVLREPMRRALEALVMERQTENKATFPPFMQRFIDESELKGRTEEAARAVLTVLRVRGIAVPETARADPRGEGPGAARALARAGHPRPVGRRGDRRPELSRLPRMAAQPAAAADGAAGR
jgi:hypothetical protein